MQGRHHATVTIAAGILLTASAPVYVPALGTAALALVPGCLAGLFLSPDLDLERGNESDWMVRRLFGRLAQKLWRAFWWPYARLAAHRGLLSHGMLIGTAGRLLYLFALGGFLAAPWLCAQAWFWWAVGGLVVSDSLHILMDRI